MNIISTALQDCFILEPNVFADERGYFVETFNATTFLQKTGLNVHFVQDNESCSNTGVLRGLHSQLGQHAQAKLVRVTKGAVIDVAVDMRKNSATYMQHVAVELTGSNKRQLFVPRGFLHGFLVLQDETIFNYKCDNTYNKASEAGVRWNDETLKIDWGILPSNVQVSEKDASLLSAIEYEGLLL